MGWNEVDREGIRAKDAKHTWNSDETPCSQASLQI